VTLAEVRELGRHSLVEYEEQGRLDVTGTRPYDCKNPPMKLEECFECFLPKVSTDTIKPLVEAFLEKLITETHGAFVMSEPPPPQSMARDCENVAHNLLRFSFMSGEEPRSGTSYFWIGCWYYPD
jgi:hypothetical protein